MEPPGAEFTSGRSQKLGGSKVTPFDIKRYLTAGPFGFMWHGEKPAVMLTITDSYYCRILRSTTCTILSRNKPYCQSLIDEEIQSGGTLPFIRTGLFRAVWACLAG